MAPEVAFEKKYTKSVDVWATGILMHYLVTGKHPFYVKSADNAASFKKKLKDLKKHLDPLDEMSWIAKNLFQRLTTIAAHMRYTSKDALAHPWITRNKYDKIPDSFMDKMNKFEQEQILKHKIQAFVFLGMMKHQNDMVNFESPAFKNYKRKVNNVVHKIKKWHEDLQMHEVEFRNDADFIQHIESPSHFSDVSSGEDEQDIADSVVDKTIKFGGGKCHHQTIKAQKLSSSAKIPNPKTSAKLKTKALAGKMQNLKSPYQKSESEEEGAMEKKRKSQFKTNKLE